MVVDHASQTGLLLCSRGIRSLVVYATRDDTQGPGEVKSTGRSAKQLSNAIDQSLNCERFHQILDIMLGQEQRDPRIGGEPGDKNEAIGQ
jgi:hypothetical protein